MVDIHVKEVFRLHGIPWKFISDRGPQYTACLMHALYKKLGIESGLMTAYHPAGNGQTERTNQEVEQYLRIFTGKWQDDWADLLPLAEFVINLRQHSATGFSPFKMVYGYQPDFTLIAGGQSNMPKVTEHIEWLKEIRKEAEAALHMAKEQMKEAYKKGKHRAQLFKAGDRVWLDAKDIAIHQKSRKLGPKRLGPFKVLEQKSDLNYRLKLPPALKVHDIFHVDRLSLYLGNGERPPPPAPVEIDGEEEYEVAEILDSRIFR